MCCMLSKFKASGKQEIVHHKDVLGLDSCKVPVGRKSHYYIARQLKEQNSMILQDANGRVSHSPHKPCLETKWHIITWFTLVS